MAVKLFVFIYFLEEIIPLIDLQAKLYVAALYFIMTSLTSVGFGNISANTKQAGYKEYST